MLGVGGDSSIWVETTDGSVALGEDTTALFDERLDGVDELLLIELFFWLLFSLINVLFKLALSWFNLWIFQVHTSAIICKMGLILSSDCPTTVAI